MIRQVIPLNFNAWMLTKYYNCILVSSSLMDVIVVTIYIFSKSGSEIYNIDLKNSISIDISPSEKYSSSAQLLILNDNLIVSVGDNIYNRNISHLKYL